jgi:hypothetical protein
LGTTKPIETIWGKKDISIKSGIQDGAKIRIKG